MISLGILNGIQWNHIYGPFKASQLIGANGSPRSVQQALQDIHRVLFQKLPVADLMTEHGVAIEPGVLRSREVSVGRHVAPTVASLAEGV
jgi:hypothetical protein